MGGNFREGVMRLREGWRDLEGEVTRGLTFARSEEGGCILGSAWMQPSGYDTSGMCGGRTSTCAWPAVRVKSGDG